MPVSENRKRLYRKILSPILAIILINKLWGIIVDPFGIENSYSDLAFYGGLLYHLILLVIFYYISYIILSFLFRIEGSKKELFSKKTINASNVVSTILFIVSSVSVFILMIIGSTLFLRGEDGIFAIFVVPLLIPIALALVWFIYKLLFGKKNEQGKITK